MSFCVTDVKNHICWIDLKKSKSILNNIFNSKSPIEPPSSGILLISKVRSANSLIKRLTPFCCNLKSKLIIHNNHSGTWCLNVNIP